jgi:hypothetical protein
MTLKIEKDVISNKNEFAIMFFYRYMKQHAMFLPLKVSQLAWRAPGDAAMIISFSLVCKTKIST